MTEEAAVDKSSMRSMIDAFPAMLSQIRLPSGLRAKARSCREKGIRGLCFAGMGGSSIPGEICRGLLDNSSTMPILTTRGYTLPKAVDELWAVLAVSYSGNTEETLSACSEAKKRGCTLFGVTSGGELTRTADRSGLLMVPTGWQPRAALPLIFSPVYHLACEILHMKPSDMKRVALVIAHHRAEWGSTIPRPQQLAAELKDRVPLFMAAQHLVPVAYRAKCQINENAKAVAIWSEIPEANHNEIESQEAFQRHAFQPIVLVSGFQHPSITRRIRITSTLLERSGVSLINLSIKTESALEETLALIHYLDMLSLELAELRGVDPLRVDRISEFKRLIEAS